MSSSSQEPTLEEGAIVIKPDRDKDLSKRFSPE